MIGKRSVGITSNLLFWHEVNYLVDDPWQNTIERECLKTFIRLMPQYLWSKIVIVGDRGFGDDPLYIVTDLSDSSVVLEIYGYRMRIEESFRDFKNERYFSLRAAGLKGVVKMEKLILVAVVDYMFVILLALLEKG